MSTGRGPKTVLGVTLALCGAALLFLLVHRQAEIFVSMPPLPAAKAAAVRTLVHRAIIDVETWGEALGSIALLAGAGARLAARRRPPARPAKPARPSGSDSRRFEELELRASRAQAEEASARARVAETEAVTAQTRALLFEQRAKADREIEMLGAQIQSLLSELTIEKDRPSAPVVRVENGGPSKANDGTPVTPPLVLEPPGVTPSIGPAALERVLAAESVRARSSKPPRHSSKSELRSETRFAAHVEVDFESDSHFYTGLSENLSEGGLFVATYAPRPVGTEIDLTLRLPGQVEPMRARATVRWIRDFSEASDAAPGMGLHFHIDDVDLPRIRRFLSTRPPLFFDDG
jgi:uncharacterized protein (TIGR02266 family)